ncbi:MAG: DNA repair protein RadC [Candidatus Woesebacteria bacterium]|jgi:DNA repair protein RadC
MTKGLNKNFIKSLPEFKRPRERLKNLGVANLTDIELLAIILSTGNKKYSVIGLAKKLIKKFPLRFFSQLNMKKLTSIHGIGPALASKILASVELGKRISQGSVLSRVNSPTKIFQLLGEIKNKKQEHALALYINARQELIHKQTVAVGGLNYNLLEARDVFLPAITLPSAYVVLAHNHPSGDCSPSEDDLLVTKRLSKAAELLGISFLDHLIVTEKNYFSFREAGII